MTEDLTVIQGDDEDEVDGFRVMFEGEGVSISFNFTESFQETPIEGKNAECVNQTFF